MSHNPAAILKSAARVTVKIGSSLLVDPAQNQLRVSWLEALCDDIADIRARSVEVIVVSSGAIALGRRVLNLQSGALKLEDSQAAAAVGQIALAHLWQESLAKRHMRAAQILLTLGDTEARKRYLNAQATLARLLQFGVVPIVNENDTVATSEIRYGDNDRLAARVATMAGCDVCVLFSDIDGLYTANPALDKGAGHIAHARAVTPSLEAMAGGAASEFSRGGMRTKLEAAKIALAGGAHLLIADGRGFYPLMALLNGARATVFEASTTPARARKTWIAGALEPKGRLIVDKGAAKALNAGKSLLPAGVSAVEGNFSRGDCVLIVTEQGADLGRGLVAYNAAHARRMCGRQSSEISAILGIEGRAEIIHRDNLALFGVEG